MNKLNVKKDDTVVIIAGKDKGKQGKILASFPKKERVIVRLPHQAPQAGRAGRPHQQGRHHQRFQRDAGMPQVQQGDPGGPRCCGR